MNGRKMFRKRLQIKQTPEHNQATGNRTNMIKSARKRKLKEFQQQRQQRQRKRRLKSNLIFNLQTLREFRFIQFVYTVRNNTVKIRKRNFKNWPAVVKSTFSRICRMWLFQLLLLLLLWPGFCKQRQRNGQMKEF